MNRLISFLSVKNKLLNISIIILIGLNLILALLIVNALQPDLPLFLLIKKGSIKPPEGMVYIPPGKFITGSKTHPEDGEPGSAETTGFFIDKCEVTNAEYDRFVRATGYVPAGGWRKYYTRGEDNYPVVDVSFKDAQAYAVWAGKRLPTAHEWDRGADGRTYPWGDKWDESRARVLEDGPEETGLNTKGASPYGVLNMADNVSEWTSDMEVRTYNTHAGSSNLSRGIKGGSWAFTEDESRCSFYHLVDPDISSHVIGFRCVKDIGAK
ncbi:MAG: formylglycine-generating enzyme family protein [Chloroflexi bacterium]|nr:formylglycine-generating enzyme family protein [Chloroflexota bacterium]